MVTENRGLAEVTEAAEPMGHLLALFENVRPAL